MEWCEQHGVAYVFGFATNAVLAEIIREDADELCVERATSAAQTLRSFRKFRYGAQSWTCERRFAAGLEATEKGPDIRYIVTSPKGAPRTFMRPYTAPAARWRTSSICTRLSSLPIAPRAAIARQSVPPDPPRRRLLAHARRA
jgi:hypothetical protein